MPRPILILTASAFCLSPAMVGALVFAAFLGRTVS